MVCQKVLKSLAWHADIFPQFQRHVWLDMWIEGTLRSNWSRDFDTIIIYNVFMWYFNCNSPKSFNFVDFGFLVLLPRTIFSFWHKTFCSSWKHSFFAELRQCLWCRWGDDQRMRPDEPPKIMESRAINNIMLAIWFTLNSIKEREQERQVRQDGPTGMVEKVMKVRREWFKRD